MSNPDVRPSPPGRANNPGLGTEFKMAFAHAGRKWVEEVDLVTVLGEELWTAGHTTVRGTGWLTHSASGYQLLPQIANLQLHDDASVNTVTTVEVRHPTLVLDGVFEYQHAAADTIGESVRQGFQNWTRGDLPVLLDALARSPGDCTALELTLPATATLPARTRRAVLGPVAHLLADPAARQRVAEMVADPDAHPPFCSCCLLTNSFLAFRPLFEGTDFFTLRLFAMRDQNGQPQADCRVNGEDFPDGADALRRYAGTWPDNGYEFRKQLVVLQNHVGQSPPAE